MTEGWLFKSEIIISLIQFKLGFERFCSTPPLSGPGISDVKNKSDGQKPLL